MKRTCLQKNTNTDGQNSCEFHPIKIILDDVLFDPKEIQQVKSFVRMKSYKISNIQAKETILRGLPKSFTNRNKKNLFKINCYLGFLLAIIIFSVCLISCKKDVPDQPSDIPALNSLNRDSLGMGNLGSVIYTVDPSRKDTATFNPNDDLLTLLSVTDANGYRWMLYIPAHGIMERQLITMTPFSTIDASHTVARIRSGVRLEPDGLQFLDRVMVSVKAPYDNPDSVQFFTFNQDGSHVEFVESYSGPSIGWIWHFSCAGYDNSQKSGNDVTDLYNKCAMEDYESGMSAAKKFIENPAPNPPEAPSISQFCRTFNKDQIDIELFEYMHSFLAPYKDITGVILDAIHRLKLAGPKSDEGLAVCMKMMQMAEQSLYKLGATYEDKKPPDKLYAMINLGICINREETLLSTDGVIPIPATLTKWTQILRDYYLDTELKKNHDYRAFPVILDLEKWVGFLDGTRRLEEIFSAMTFKVSIDTKFYAKWKYSSDSYDMGNVLQKADIDIKLDQETLLWGEANNLALNYITGSSFTFHNSGKTNGDFTATGLTFKGSTWLKNWDPCLTKTFDVMISDFDGTEISSGENTLPVAGSSASVCFSNFRWPGAGMAYMFSVPIHNLNKILGDTTYTASGSKEGDQFTCNSQVHIKIEHTP
jgi:hypothetical protein